MKFYPFKRQFTRVNLTCKHCKRKFCTDVEKEELFMIYSKHKEGFTLMHYRKYKNFIVNCGPVGKTNT